jgi:hypothetical protein
MTIDASLNEERRRLNELHEERRRTRRLLINHGADQTRTYLAGIEVIAKALGLDAGKLRDAAHEFITELENADV